MNLGLAAIVVLYQPDNNVINNIESYVDRVSKLYIIDNSSNDNSDLIELNFNKKKTEYRFLDGNKGIAKALNVGMKMARMDGYNYVLTMDQDSRFECGELEKYITYSKRLFDFNKKLIICGLNHLGYISHGQDEELADEVITSGMMIDLNKAEEIGDFLDKLFIDFVDYEFCYRAKKRGYFCIVITNCMLTHQVGSIQPKRLFGRLFGNHNEHGKVRMYYIVRNALYTMVNYPDKFINVVFFTLRLVLKMLFLDTDRLNKCIYGLYGLRDFFRGKYGEICIKR